MTDQSNNATAEAGINNAEFNKEVETCLMAMKATNVELLDSGISFIAVSLANSISAVEILAAYSVGRGAPIEHVEGALEAMFEDMRAAAKVKFEEFSNMEAKAA